MTDRAIPSLRAAEPGAHVPRSTVPLCVPCIDGSAWAYVKECLDTGWVSSVGSFVDRFEQTLAAYLGARHAVATVSGTAALHVALRVAGVRPDDEVLVSSLSFIAPANAIRYLGAWPVFVDAEPAYWQMDAALVASFLSACDRRPDGLYNPKSRRRVSALLPVDILGHPVDMDPLLALADTYGLPIVEDATEALGATYQGRRAGTLGHVACLSFNGNKLITTGGGGMILTDRTEWATRARHLTTQAKRDPIEFVHDEIGYNYRLTNVLAALGCSQAERLDEFVAVKRRIAAGYTEALGAIRGIRPMPEAPWAASAFWMYTALIDEPAYGCDSRAVLRRLDAAGIQARPLWQPLHLSPAHADAAQSKCPVAERLNRDAVSLPCSVGLTPDQQTRVIDALAAH